MTFNDVQGFSNIKDALSLFRITEKEVKAIQAYSKDARASIKQFIDDFYVWIPEVPEYKTLFAQTGLVAHVKVQQVNYWKEFFECNLDEQYLQSRYKVGNIHAKIGLPISSYVAGMSFSADWWTAKITSQRLKLKDAAFLIQSMTKLLYFDCAIITASYSQATNELIQQQSAALMALSTPTIQLWQHVLVLPILGVLDSKRVQNMTDVMLHKILETSARSVIVDITGVPSVDSSVANYLIKITKATKLMGCECVLSGIGPEVAQTLVQLGINLESIETSANLKSAFQNVLMKMGYQINYSANQPMNVR